MSSGGLRARLAGAGPLEVGFPSATNHNPWIATPCAFSPDRELVACADLKHGIAGTTAYQLAVINVRTATSIVIAGTTSDQSDEPVVWTADNRQPCRPARRRMAQKPRGSMSKNRIPVRRRWQEKAPLTNHKE